MLKFGQDINITTTIKKKNITVHNLLIYVGNCFNF